MIKKITLAALLLASLSSYAARLSYVAEFKNLTLTGTPGSHLVNAIFPVESGVLPADYYIVKDISNTYPAGIVYASASVLRVSPLSDSAYVAIVSLSHVYVPAYPPIVDILVLRVVP